MGEHLPCKQGVDSSNLFISTSCAEGKRERRDREPEGEGPRVAKAEGAGAGTRKRESQKRAGRRHETGVLANMGS